MSFALVKFYEEDTWEVIPVGNIILEERHRGLESLEGLKTLVIWEDPSSSKGKGKARAKYAQKVPAKIIKVSDNKDYLFKVLKGEDEETPSKQGKGQRKRVVNSKYAWQSDVDEENTTKKSNRFIESDSSDDEKPPNSEITDQLLRENKALKDENARLRQELHNIEDPVTLAKTQEALDMSRRRMQEKLDAKAAEYAEKMEELEEVKRQEKIDDWERHQKGCGYKSKHAKDVDDKKQQENNKKSRRLRNTDHNPLTGSSSGSSFRPASRRNTGGG